MLVLEKLRAIRIKHPDYLYRQDTGNRARDFYDIGALKIEITDSTAGSIK
jgi:hypothetical protein